MGTTRPAGHPYYRTSAPDGLLNAPQTGTIRIGQSGRTARFRTHALEVAAFVLTLLLIILMGS